MKDCFRYIAWFRKNYPEDPWEKALGTLRMIPKLYIWTFITFF